MASHPLLVFIISLFLGLNFMGTGSQGTNLTISPDRCIATIVNEVQMLCVPNSDDDEDRQITLIEISRNNEGPIVFLQQCANMSYGRDASTRFKAEGFIGKHSSQTYLNLTLINPKSEDTGIYTCAIYYVDDTGVLRNEKASHNFVVEKMDVKALETVLNTLKDRITDIEEKKQDKLDVDITRQITNLDRKIQQLENKATTTPTVAFTAVDNRESITTVSGKVLIFPNTIMNEGDGYEESTGTFIAPIKGLYYFHLSLTSKTSNQWTIVHIRANDNVLTEIGVGDKTYYVQTSGSAIAKLEVGDKVYPFVTDDQPLKGGKRSSFSGFLITPF